MSQEAPSGGSAGSSSSGSGSSSGATDTPSSNPVLGSGSGSSSSFNIFSSEPPKLPPPSTPGTTETEGTGAAATAAESATTKTAAPSFTVPGFYGQGSTTFFGGSGRLARPRFRMSGTFGFGYDDNLNSFPRSGTPRLPFIGASSVIQTDTQPQQIQTAEPQPIYGVVGYRFVNNGFGFRSVPVYGVVGQTEAQFEDVPVTPPADVVASFFTRVGLSMEMLRYSPRSLFTLDASGSETYYWDRDQDPSEYSGSFAMTYLYRVTPRLQVTAQANIAYLSQPDLSRPNTPQTQLNGNLLNPVARLDLTYRFSPRISLTGTANFSGNYYTKKAEQSGDYYSYTFGLEGRYLWSPRLSFSAEIRHATNVYDQTADLDSDTEYLLLGGEFVLNPRLSGSLRLGESLKRFKQGDSQTAPYVESSISYRSTSRSSVSWNNRFGFEEPPSPTIERLVYRSTIAYKYMFSPRLVGDANINLIHEVSHPTNGGDDTGIDTVEISLGLDYDVTRNFSLNANYTFTLSNSSNELSDYYRDRIFVGGQYNF